MVSHNCSPTEYQFERSYWRAAGELVSLYNNAMDVKFSRAIVDIDLVGTVTDECCLNTRAAYVLASRIDRPIVED